MRRVSRLSGKDFDLDDLLIMFSKGEWQVTKDDNGLFHLSMDIADDADHKQVLSIAEDRLAMMNGIAFARVGDYQPVRISGTLVTDPKTGKTAIQVAGKVVFKGPRARLRAVGVALNSDGTPAKTREVKPYGAVVVDLLSSNDALQRALFLYGKLGHSWRELYMVFEAIQDGNKGRLLQQPWVDKGALKAFKATANSYKALGHEARHGTKKKGIATPSITLRDARQLIRKVLTDWINQLGLRQ